VSCPSVCLSVCLPCTDAHITRAQLETRAGDELGPNYANSRFTKSIVRRTAALYVSTGPTFFFLVDVNSSIRPTLKLATKILSVWQKIVHVDGRPIYRVGQKVS